MLARGLVGLGEGVALPAMNNLVANNVPPARRSTALGGCFTGFHTGQYGFTYLNIFASWRSVTRTMSAASLLGGVADHCL